MNKLNPGPPFHKPLKASVTGNLGPALPMLLLLGVTKDVCTIVGVVELLGLVMYRL